MREVRMTFGEHLEDLRRRIFMALLWLFLSGVICFVFGKTLLRWTMVPHEHAIRGAMRDRSISLLEEKGRELASIIAGGASGSPALAEEEGSPWERLFAVEIRRARLSGALRDFGRRSILPLVEGKVEAARLDALWGEFALAIEGSLGNEAASLSARSLPERFALLEEDLRQTAKRTASLPIKRLLGVGKSLDSAIAYLAEFNQFLAARKKALEE